MRCCWEKCASDGISRPPKGAMQGGALFREVGGGGGVPPQGKTVPSQNRTTAHHGAQKLQQKTKQQNNVGVMDMDTEMYYHTRPRGKHVRAIRFPCRESDSKCPAKIQGIQVAVPHNILTLKKIQ